MADKIDTEHYEKWSNLLQRVALSSTRRPSTEIVQNLDENEIEVLRQLIKKKPSSQDIQLDKVIATLVEREPTTATGKLLKLIIDDEHRPLLERTVAAFEIASTPASNAETILLKHIEDKQPQFAQRVIQSLGKIGSNKTLKKLQAMSRPENAAIRRQWIFSKNLIRHRLGEKSNDEPVLKGTSWNNEDTNARPLPVEAIDSQRLQACIEGLKGKSLGIEFAQDRGATITGDGLVSHLLTNKSLSTESGRRALSKKPMVAAIITMWDQRQNKPILDQVILTSPYEQGILIQGFRLDGILLFEGTGRLNKDELIFSVTGVDRPGQCRFRLSGQLRSEGLVAQAETMPRHKGRTTFAMAESDYLH